jgi:hypothetical protein
MNPREFFADIFGVESEIAKPIAETLQAKLTGCLFLQFDDHVVGLRLPGILYGN